MESEKFLKILSGIVEDPNLEMEWLDLLSQLEYVGCRKIVKSLPYDRITLEVLQHVFEESSHAFLLKSVAEKKGLARRTWQSAPLSRIGWAYFQELDQRISSLTPQAVWNYPGVSWAIESRVLWVYPRYHEMTRDEGVRGVLARILAQEKRHSAQFHEVDFPADLREKMLAIEAELWGGFENALEDFVSNRK